MSSCTEFAEQILADTRARAVSADALAWPAMQKPALLLAEPAGCSASLVSEAIRRQETEFRHDANTRGIRSPPPAGYGWAIIPRMPTLTSRYPRFRLPEPPHAAHSSHSGGLIGAALRPRHRVAVVRDRPRHDPARRADGEPRWKWWKPSSTSTWRVGNGSPALGATFASYISSR